MSSTVNDDYHPAPADRTTQRNGGAHYNGNGYPAQHAPAAATEADRRAYNYVRRGSAHAVPAGAGAQEKADGTLKQPAGRNGMVAAADGARGVAHNNYYYNGREQPAHREDAAAAAASDFYHHHPAATATAGHERY
jgi:hypothetical protein